MFIIKKNIVAITGSNNANSKTKKVTDKILDELIKLNSGYEYKNILLGDFDIKYCIGCQKCFKNGFCEMDNFDNFTFIREDMKNADIIIFTSPVYVDSVSGIMKTFLDRLSYQCHILSLSGKLGFTLAVGDQGGTEKVNEHLDSMLKHLGVKVLSSYSFLNINDSIYEKTSLIAKDILKKTQENYGYSNYYLERLFKAYKVEYISEAYKNKISKHNEIKFWNQNWIKKTDSFQEFAIKKRSIDHDFTEK